VKRKRRSTAGRLGLRHAGTVSDDLDWPRSLAVHWCDGEQSKIRMQESRVKISAKKIEKRGEESRNDEVSRAEKTA
jgi:hypothetical protein